MDNNKTLIAYATKGKVTKETAELIAEILRKDYSLEVDLNDLKQEPSPDVSNYSNVVVGSGVRMGRIYKRALNFLGKDFSGKKVAVFLSSMEAGDERSHEEAMGKYVKDKILNTLNVEPVSAEAFGGRIRIFGFTLSDNIDNEKVTNWASVIGKKFTTE